MILRLRPFHVLGLLFLFVVNQLGVRASEPIVWKSDTRAEILRGESRGVSVTDTGALTLAPKSTSLFNTEQAYIWSSVIDNAGNVYLGTGHDGRLYRVGADGRGTLLTDTAELDVTALAIGRDNTLYAGTSPEGKVYRISADGRAEVYFDPPDKYIWSLAVMDDGAIAIGTGDNGKIYRVRAAGEKAESSLLIDVDETHVISLESDNRGHLIAGTDPGGLVLRVSPDGKAFALFDAPLREIHALAPTADGSLYVLALGDAASAARISSSGPLPGPPAAGGSVTVTVTPIDDGTGAATQAAAAAAGASPPTIRSRSDLSNARSAVFRIAADGATDVLWSSNTITAFSIAATPERVLIGTSEKGRIYSVTNDGRDKLLLQTSEDQISSLKMRGPDVYAASSNQGKLFRFGSDAIEEGTYESIVRDARFVSTWGRIWWRGRGNVELQTRTGNTERPDATWSSWSAPYRDVGGSAVSSPRARFIQWRASLRGAPNGASAIVEDVNLAYLPHNVAPEILAITSLPTGVGLQPAVQLQVDPNVESSGLNPAIFGGIAQVPPRRIFQRGAVSLQWQAEDRNGDELEYAVYYRAVSETNYRLLKDELKDNFYTIDSAALADGQYIFKIVVSDKPGNTANRALTGERFSELIQIDNTPPVLNVAEQSKTSSGQLAPVRFAVEDATGMIKKADVSIDGGPWRSVTPDDGIADGPRESYTIDAIPQTPGEHSISLRVFDGNGNVGSMRTVVRR